MRKIFAVLAALICCLSVWTSVPAAQAFTLDKEDGEYSIQVELEGGSGKASVTSPTLITVKNGEVTADIQWSSSNYDYMIVDGEKYLPVNEEGTNSEFQIPVTIMDESMPGIADTTAMGTPHEINYTLTFYSDSTVGKYAGNIMAFPTTVLVDKDGNIVGEPFMGGIDDQSNYDQLMKQIQSVLDQK